MKLIHTADWHIGQSFFEYDRREEHALFFRWLKEQLRAEAIDVLLIAGDVFDSPNPSAESQRIYYRFLREVTAENPRLQVVVIAGNHDSAARLEAPNPLLEEMNIVVKGVVRRTAEGEIDYDNLVVPLREGGKIVALCLAVPYLRQGDYPPAESYASGVKRMYKALYDRARDAGLPVIAMGHLQATGAELSDNDRSERAVIGGLEAVSPEAFAEGIAYTALGHLHKAQRVAGREHVRYAGAPLPFSFAEKNYRQGVYRVTLTDRVTVEHLLFEAPVKLLTVPDEPKPLGEVLTAIAGLPDGEITSASPYLEVRVLITEPEPSLRHRIEEALSGKSVRLARLSAVTPSTKGETGTLTYEELQTIHPVEMAEDLFRRRFGGEEMPEHMKRLLQTVIQEIER